MRKIDLIVIHCSATKVTRDFSVEDLEACHKARGFKCTGYHYYITKDGQVHRCRPEEMVGAHARRYNRYSIGIFKVGFSSIGVIRLEDCGAANITTRRVLFQPETSRVVVGQQKMSNGSVKQKYVNAITLLKDVVFEETHDNAMNVEEPETPGSDNNGEGGGE